MRNLIEIKILKNHLKETKNTEKEKIIEIIKKVLKIKIRNFITENNIKIIYLILIMEI